MLENIKRVNKYNMIKHVFTYLLLILSGYLLSLVIYPRKPSEKILQPPQISIQPILFQEDNLPYLPLSPLLFTKYSLRTGTETPDLIIIIDEANTVSVPSTTITLKQENYSNEARDLPPIHKDSEIFTHFYSKEEGKNVPGRFPEHKREQINKYGDLARRFLIPEKENKITAGLEFIDEIKEADVDSDGKKEQIIELSTTGANYWETRSLILKNNKIIFTANGKFPEIIPSESYNGFTLEWGDNFKKRVGYMKTRFIWENSKFIPVFEQQVRYLKVGKNE